MPDQRSYAQQVNVAFTRLLEEYATDEACPIQETKHVTALDVDGNTKAVENFLRLGCGCKNNCSMLFSVEEFLTARFKFVSYTKEEKNCYLLSQTQAIARCGVASHARTTHVRKRQTFKYCINFDRPVCKQTFLFYHNETDERLRRIQQHFLKNGCQPLLHGNTGKKSPISYGEGDCKAVVDFIFNLAECHGMPDPGRDVRKGKGRLRILLPSIMNYTSIHELYVDSVTATKGAAVGYDTLIKIWQSKLPYIAFNNPKTDLCLTCENFKKQLNKIASILDEDKEEQQKVVYQEAVLHLKHVQQERLYYQACVEIAHKCLRSFEEQKFTCNKPNSRDIAIHYSWDFAQQLQYPFEDQQVGPIYFKTPRRAQLFGVCCEAMPCQVNYLIDEADFTEKNANTVVSLLDHFFSHYGFGEKEVYLTADNCTGQNKK